LNVAGTIYTNGNISALGYITSDELSTRIITTTGNISGNTLTATGNTLTCKAYYCYVIGGSLIFGPYSNTTDTSLSYCIWVGGKTSDIITYQTQANTWIDANAQLTINQTNSSVSPPINPIWIIPNTFLTILKTRRI
jgi:hypothetical protein